MADQTPNPAGRDRRRRAAAGRRGDTVIASLEERAAEIDTDRYTGGSAPEPRTLACPECEFMPLIRMVDAARPDIHFESCKRCYGRYYDAGEFREVSEDPSFLERLFGRD